MTIAIFGSILLGKVTMNPTVRSEFSLTGSYQKAQWNASGEIPFRAVADGTIDRFGAIDPSEGGKTLRSTGRMKYHYDTPSGGQFFANAYGQYYRLDLFTNFTFFFNDPVNGDGIQQSDRRDMYGGDLDISREERCWASPSRDGGISGPQRQHFQYPTGDTDEAYTDRDHVESAVEEASYAPYVKLEVQPTSWMRLSGGVRADYFTFDVRNRCAHVPQQPAGRKDSGQVIPKGNLILGPWASTEFFANYGEGYHSNDARSTWPATVLLWPRAQGV